jgi:hypothetical protein
MRCVLVLFAVAACGDNQPGTVAFRKIVLTSEFYAEGASFGDFDGDGVGDAVAGPYWYRGPRFDQRHEIYPAVAFDPHTWSENFFAWVADFNADGMPDVLVVGFPGHLATWYENPGADVDWTAHVAFVGVDDESPAFTDLTGDGAPELVFAHGGQLGWATPNATGAWPFTPATPNINVTTFTHGLGVGDIDGDGTQDLLLASGAWLAPAWTSLPATFGAGGAQIYAFDIDGDGEPDVVTTMTAHEYGLSWFQQHEGTFEQRVILPTEPGPDDPVVLFQPHALAVADIDGDGLLDLICGERFWAHVPPNANFADPASLYWFQHVRDAEGDRFVPHLIDDQSGVGTQVVAGDIDGDGLIDIVVSNKKGAFVFLQERR